jgi:hypothetical protein
MSMWRLRGGCRMRKSKSNESRYVTSAHDSRELQMFVVCSVLVQGQGGRQAQGGARRPHTPSAVPTYLYLRTNGRVRQQTYHSSGTFAATGVVVGGRGFFAHRPTHPRPGSAISPLSALRLQHTAFRFRSSCVRVYTRSGHGWKRRPAPRPRWPGAAARPRGGVVPAPRDRGEPPGPDAPSEGPTLAGDRAPRDRSVTGPAVGLVHTTKRRRDM